MNVKRGPRALGLLAGAVVSVSVLAAPAGAADTQQELHGWGSLDVTNQEPTETLARCGMEMFGTVRGESATIEEFVVDCEDGVTVEATNLPWTIEHDQDNAGRFWGEGGETFTITTPEGACQYQGGQLLGTWQFPTSIWSISFGRTLKVSGDCGGADRVHLGNFGGPIDGIEDWNG